MLLSHAGSLRACDVIALRRWQKRVRVGAKLARFGPDLFRLEFLRPPPPSQMAHSTPHGAVELDSDDEVWQCDDRPRPLHNGSALALPLASLPLAASTPRAAR